MSFDPTNLLLKKMDEISKEMTQIRVELLEVKADGKETKAQTIKTNGRVTALELWRHGIDTLEMARSRWRPSVLSFLTGAALVILAWYLNSI